VHEAFYDLPVSATAPCEFNEVFKMQGTPVSRSNASSNRRKRGLSAADKMLSDKDLAECDRIAEVTNDPSPRT
jgi:hypothetical protein